MTSGRGGATVEADDLETFTAFAGRVGSHLGAERAGVSIASASRALNGLAASAETTARVRAAAEELGYVPNSTARSLKASRTEQLVLSVADVGNPVYVAMMRAVEDVVRTAGYRLVLASTGSDPQEEVAILRGLARGYADGMILSPLRVTDDLLEELGRAAVPVVVVGTVPEQAGLDNVRADSPHGVRLALQHLYEGGRRRIAFVNGPADTVPGSARARGFRRTAAELGLDDDPALLATAADFTFAAGRAAASALLDRARPDALLGANDLLAIGALHELDARGLSVPEDVALVGMDDTDLAVLSRPGLTSVDLRSADRGRLAASLLLDRIADPGRPPRQLEVQARLAVRGSSAPQRTRAAAADLAESLA